MSNHKGTKHDIKIINSDRVDISTREFKEYYKGLLVNFINIYVLVDWPK